MPRTQKQHEMSPLRNKGESSDTESPIIPFMSAYRRGERRRRRQPKSFVGDSMPLHHPTAEHTSAAAAASTNAHVPLSGPHGYVRGRRNKFEPFRRRRGGRSQISYIIWTLKAGLVVVILVYGTIIWRVDRDQMDHIFDLEGHIANPLSKRIPLSVEEEQDSVSGIHDRYEYGVDPNRIAKSDAATRAELWTKNEQERYRESQLKHQERRDRTRPPSIDAEIMETYIKSYSLSFLSEEETFLNNEKVTRREEEQDDDRPESTSICSLGRADNDSESFSPSLALNSDSKVLITGIFSRVGFHLALKLATECNVQVMIGIDPMYPNTQSNRFYILEQMSILYRNVPKFQRPVILPFVGLDPKEQYFKGHFPNMMNHLGEFDFSQFNPTHVVHLSNVDPYTYRRFQMEGDDLKNNDLESLFGLRQSLIGLEHLLHTCLDQEPYPHFTLVSTVDALVSMERLRNKTDSTGNNDLHPTSKLLEEILFQKYFYRSNLAHVGIRLPYVYGPWGNPNSLDFVFVQKLMDYWKEKDDVSKFEGERDQQLLERIGDILFVDGMYPFCTFLFHDLV